MKMKNNFDIVAFSHLRWDYVYQRPQQILERFGKKHKVLFIEEQIPHVSLHGIPNIVEVSKNITALQPRIHHENFLKEYEELLDKYLPRFGIKDPVLWFYGPGFEKLAEKVEHTAIVYDCMDEHSAFKNAYSEGLIKNERNLLAKADIVFTGGKSLFEAKKEFVKNIHCFPSSVDIAHFQKALEKDTKVPKDLLSIKKPVVAYYAVIDERADLELIAEIADLMPKYSFVMIGPVAEGKVNINDLPKRENIYWMGGKPYDQLPNYLKGFDICMMPFALNQATKFISPTKTLEYMAALKPIISTPVYDVARDYSEMVSIVTNAKEFKEAVEYYLNEPKDKKDKRVELQKEVLKKTSWDQTANQMEDLILEAISKKSTVANTSAAVIRQNSISK